MFILLQDTAVVRYRYFNGVAIKGQKIQVVHCEISGKRFRGGSNIFPCTPLINFNPVKTSASLFCKQLICFDVAKFFDHLHILKNHIVSIRTNEIHYVYSFVLSYLNNELTIFRKISVISINKCILFK
mgnify:CR=1 FL=1